MASSQAYWTYTLWGRTGDGTGRPEPTRTMLSCSGRMYWATTQYSEILVMAFAPPISLVPSSRQIIWPYNLSRVHGLTSYTLSYTPTWFQGCQMSIDRICAGIVQRFVSSYSSWMPCKVILSAVCRVIRSATLIRNRTWCVYGYV
jgi:hypothetical protein